MEFQCNSIMSYNQSSTFANVPLAYCIVDHEWYPVLLLPCSLVFLNFSCFIAWTHSNHSEAIIASTSWVFYNLYTFTYPTTSFYRFSFKFSMFSRFTFKLASSNSMCSLYYLTNISYCYIFVFVSSFCYLNSFSWITIVAYIWT